MTEEATTQAVPHFFHGGVDLTGKKVLVIGSGRDLNGRGMADSIDRLPQDGGTYDLVIRCNKMLGDPADVGHRCDLAAVRYPEWTKKYGLAHATQYISFNGSYLGGMPARYPGNWSRREREALADEIGVKWPSCGALAVAWARTRGCSKEDLHVIGFGYDPETGCFAREKRDPAGTLDENPNYDWAAENAWLRKTVTLL